MAKSLDRNEAAFLAALEAEDPNSEQWISCWALPLKAHGADVVAQSIEGSFAVAKRLTTRKLVDKSPGRSTKTDNGYSINAAGKEALAAWLSEQGLDGSGLSSGYEKDEVES